MAVFAVVNPDGGVVTNTIVGESLEAVLPFVGPCVEVTETTGVAEIGATWDPETQTFIRLVV
jgi:hypothetical protein